MTNLACLPKAFVGAMRPIQNFAGNVFKLIEANHASNDPPH
jgi:hypothetical protein